MAVFLPLLAAAQTPAAAPVPLTVPSGAPARVLVMASAEVLRAGSNDPRSPADAPARQITRRDAATWLIEYD